MFYFTLLYSVLKERTNTYSCQNDLQSQAEKTSSHLSQ